MREFYLGGDYLLWLHTHITNKNTKWQQQQWQHETYKTLWTKYYVITIYCCCVIITVVNLFSVVLFVVQIMTITDISLPSIFIITKICRHFKLKGLLYASISFIMSHDVYLLFSFYLRIVSWIPDDSFLSYILLAFWYTNCDAPIKQIFVYIYLFNQACCSITLSTDPSDCIFLVLIALSNFLLISDCILILPLFLSKKTYCRLLCGGGWW